MKLVYRIALIIRHIINKLLGRWPDALFVLECSTKVTDLPKKVAELPKKCHVTGKLVFA